MTLAFTIFGAAPSWRRARVSSRGARPRIFNDPLTEADEERVRAAAVVAMHSCGALPFEGPVAVEVRLWFPRPIAKQRKKDRGSSSVPYAGKPDIDNTLKALLDGMTRAGLWRDDTQVAHVRMTRTYLDLDADGNLVGLPRTEVCVSPIAVPAMRVVALAS